MKSRLLHAVAILAVALLPVPLAAQSAKPTKTWTAPLTPDGQPDLQGVWLSNAATPLERPKELAGRKSLTDAEVAELKKRADRLFKSLDSDFAAGDNAFLAALANPGVYRNPGSTGGALDMIEREFDNRTSLVIDPPDGRIPPMTPAGERRQAVAAAKAVAQPPLAGPESLTNFMRCITYGVP